jgi:hypothetical protein
MNSDLLAPLAEYYMPGRIGAVRLEYLLRKVQPNRASGPFPTFSSHSLSELANQINEEW